MNTFQLKMLAAGFMLIDHVGLVYYPSEIFFRVIGRLSFPLFAFVLAEGFKYTSNVYKYLLRLLVAAIISEPVFQIVVGNQNRNIFFTLLFGLVSLLIYEKIKQKILGVLVVICIALLAVVLNFDYSAYGVLLPFIFGVTDRRYNYFSMYGLVSAITLMFIGYIVYANPSVSFNNLGPWSYLQVYSLFSLVFIHFYNEQKGFGVKYFFYFFYPAHLGILGILKLWLR